MRADRVAQNVGVDIQRIYERQEYVSEGNEQIHTVYPLGDTTPDGFHVHHQEDWTRT